MTPSQVLRGVANLLRREGWCQRVAVDGEGRRCLLGALHAVASREMIAWGVAHNLIIQQVGHDIAGWNDGARRTAEEVIAMLERAAEIGEPEKRRVLMPVEVPIAPMTPDSPLWTEPAPEEPKRIPEKVPA